MIIREPRWIQPVIASPGGSFHVVVEGAGQNSVDLALRRGDEVYALESGDDEAAETDRFRVLGCSLSEETPEGLFALAARSDRETATVPKAVSVRREYALPFTFVHTTDLHLIKDGPDGRLYDRREALERLVEEINAADPAFVMNTGDVVSRYGTTSTELLPASTVEWQFRELKRILLKLNSPMFLIAGNHDRAFSWCRQAWDRTMGEPWNRSWDDYRFDFGECAHFCLDGSIEYDDATGRAVAGGYSDARLDWLARELRNAAGRRFRLLCHHYDYGRKLVEVAHEGGVDLMLFGHAKRRAYKDGDDPPFPISYLAAHEAWRPISVSKDGVSLGAARTFAEIGGFRLFDFSQETG